MAGVKVEKGGSQYQVVEWLSFRRAVSQVYRESRASDRVKGAQ